MNKNIYQSESKLLWENKDYNFDLKNEEIINEGYIYKKKSNKVIYKKKYFILTSNYLIYKKTKESNEIKGIIINDWVKFKYEEIDYENFKTKITLTKNNKFVELFLITNDWIYFFKKNFINTNFHDNFSAIKMIGKGSFASVYLIKNIESKEKFAVKSFSKEYLLTQKNGFLSLKNEINIIRQNDHDNLLKFYEVYETDNSIYIITELLKGGNLIQYLSKSNTIQDCKVVMKALLEALEYLHDKNIMHRDLKPDNIVLKDKVNKLNKSNLKIVDFGLATKTNLENYIFKKCGTPGFIAPEILNMKSNEDVKYDKKCDIFSAGVIFYILLNGIPPFLSKKQEEIIKLNKICDIDFDFEKLKKNKDAYDLLKKMLEKDPSLRISAKESLSHIFFSENDINLENNSFNYENLKFKNIDSIEVKENIINGQINTYKDSYCSLKDNKKSKRDSIYKRMNNNNNSSDYSEDNNEFEKVKEKRKSKFNSN